MKIFKTWFFAGLATLMVATAGAGEKLSIKGSNTFGEELGPQLISAFRERNPDVEIALEKLGSGSGIAALLDGTCNIAASSRMLNEDEQRLAKSRGIKLKATAIGYYGVAVIVNAQNPLRNLTDRNVRDIFTGAATNWKQLRGHDQPIEVLIRDATGGTHLGFQELAMERMPYEKSAIEFASYSELAKEVAARPNAVGYVAMNLDTREGLRAVSINGIPPNDFAVNEGLYPYVRKIWLYVRTNPEDKTAQRFVRFVRSKTGQKIVEDIGFVRMNLPRLPTAEPM